MPSRTVTISVVGDVSKGGKSLDEFAKKADDTGEKLGSAFDGALGALNDSGVLGPFGASLDAIGEKFDFLGMKGMSLGEKVGGIGLGVAAAGAGLSMLAGEAKQSSESLKAAVESTGAAYATYEDRINAAAKANLKFGYSRKDTEDALKNMVDLTGDTSKALANLGLATDMASGKDGDLAAAGSTVGKVLNGNYKALKAYGISVKDTTEADANLVEAKRKLEYVEAGLEGKRKKSKTDLMRLADAQAEVTRATQEQTKAHAENGKVFHSGAEAMAAVAAKTAGQSEARVAGYSGGLLKQKTKVEDLATGFGAKAGVPMQIGGTLATVGVMASMALNMRKVAQATTAASAATAVLGTTSVAAGGAATIAWLPFLATWGLIILGIAAVAIGFYQLLDHWDTVWGGIKKGGDWVLRTLKDVGLGILEFVLAPINWVISGLNKLPGVDIGHVGPGGGSHGGGVGAQAAFAQPAAALPAFNGGGGGGPTTVNTNLHLDGQTIAKHTASYTRDELLQQQRNTGTSGLN